MDACNDTLFIIATLTLEINQAATSQQLTQKLCLIIIWS
jgi:hypothetical protein